MENINKLLERCKENLNVFDALAKAHDVINSPKYKNIMCSISGGSDSYNRHLEKKQELENEQVKLLEQLRATL